MTDWTPNDIEFWTVARTPAGDWAVVDTRTDRIVRRFRSPGAAEAWVHAALRGAV
ncbi:MAG TPA: hypothetical protein VM597_22485 [Gemmataceae bacterium]|jgi:hypothetical protein|nr:hypothetical protein [Gemmataceae bacterium]